MKKNLLFNLVFLFINTIPTVMAANLLDVYQQALANDPTYLQAAAQRLNDQQKVCGFANCMASNATLIGQQADAVFNSASEDLIIRVSQAYFNVLRDEDNLVYSRANKENLKKALENTIQQYKEGEKTQTDVHMAKSSYETAAASYVAAETTVAGGKEDLRAITGNTYARLDKLSERFPLVWPHPRDMEMWAEKARRQNWSVKAAKYANAIAETNRCTCEYLITSQQLEQAIRSAMNTASHSYLAIITDIKKVQADKQAIQSAVYSLQGLKEEYRSGDRRLVEVLDQQQKVFQAQTQYATDRYAYINHRLELKKAVGALNSQDLIAINEWLRADSPAAIQCSNEKFYSSEDEKERAPHKVRKEIHHQKQIAVTSEKKRPVVKSCRQAIGLSKAHKKDANVPKTCRRPLSSIQRKALQEF